jgi:predicted acylesterase/phospholipase RssA
MIKHIVLESGAYLGLYTLGALYELSKKNYYKIEDIETIYGTSIGSYVGVLLCLNINWDDLIEYFVDRPWHKSVKIKPLVNFYRDKGFLDESIFKISLENLFLAKDLCLDVTFQELYDFSKIELHMFTVEIQNFKLIDLSYKTHPKMKIMDGVYQSCAMPYIFKPHWYKNNYYIDGGVINNYPIQDCIENGGDRNNILGIKFLRDPLNQVTESSNIFQFSRHLHSRLIEVSRKLRNKDKDFTIKNEIIIPGAQLDVQECFKLIRDRNHRNSYVNVGKENAIKFLSQCSA